MICAFTFLKILISKNKLHFGSRLAAGLLFVLAYSILFICLFVMLGNFFNNGGKQMELTIRRSTILLLLLNYALNFVVNFMLTGNFRRSHFPEVIKENLWHAGVLFLIVLLLLLPFRHWINHPNLNYPMVIGIILAKNIADFLVMHFRNKNLAPHLT